MLLIQLDPQACCFLTLELGTSTDSTCMIMTYEQYVKDTFGFIQRVFLIFDLNSIYLKNDINMLYTEYIG